MLIWLIGDLIMTFTMIAIWNSSSGSGLIGGYSRSQLTTYYLVALYLQWVVLWWPFSEIFREIKNGDIIITCLSKPISYYFSWFFMDLGWHLVSSFVGFFTTVLITIYLRTDLSLSLKPEFLLFFVLAVVLAIFVTYSISVCLGLLAFWFTEVGAIESFFWLGRGFFGGAALPISFIPETLRSLVIILPFRYVFSFPLEIILGKLLPVEIFLGFMLGFFWLTLLVLVYKLMWDKGRKVYSAYGQ